MNQTSREPIFGAGIDRDHRPGVPMETEPQAIGNAHWNEPERQEPKVRVLKRATLDELTPVFSNALPPRGLSGLVRRLAYRIPEHRPTHWLLLLLGDRIDVVEHRGARALKIVAPLALAGLAIVRTTRTTLRRRRRRSVFARLGLR